MQTCLVQVPRQLNRRLHLHVVLEEAAAERGVVVGLARLGLDGLLVPGLRHLRRHGPAAAHGGVVVRPVRHRVWLLAAEEGPDGPVLVRHAVRKNPLEALKRVAAHSVAPPDLQHGQGLVARLKLEFDANRDCMPCSNTTFQTLN